jgi:hypothetical protein
MGRNTTRTQNLTRIGADDLSGSDVIVIGPASGDRAKGITVDDFTDRFNGGYNVERFTSAGTIDSATDLALSEGTFTLNMPTSADAPITIKSVSGTTTLNGVGNTFENGTTVIFPAATTLYLDGTVWRNV